MSNQNFRKTQLQVLSPEEFVKLYETNRKSIINSSIIPPELGKPGFGNIIVECRGTPDLSEQYLRKIKSK